VVGSKNVEEKNCPICFIVIERSSKDRIDEEMDSAVHICRQYYKPLKIK
jgi:hypothetical protein